MRGFLARETYRKLLEMKAKEAATVRSFLLDSYQLGKEFWDKSAFYQEADQLRHEEEIRQQQEEEKRKREEEEKRVEEEERRRIEEEERRRKEEEEKLKEERER